MRRMATLGLALAMFGGTALAKVERSIEESYVERLEGRTLVARIDLKVLKVQKQVRGDRNAGFAGGENLEQVKDATEITVDGVRYRDEAHGREWLYAPRGSRLVVEKVRFGRTAVEMKVRGTQARESTVVTFHFDDKLDPSFSSRELFEKMLRFAFDGVE